MTASAVTAEVKVNVVTTIPDLEQATEPEVTAVVESIGQAMETIEVAAKTEMETKVQEQPIEALRTSVVQVVTCLTIGAPATYAPAPDVLASTVAKIKDITGFDCVTIELGGSTGRRLQSLDGLDLSWLSEATIEVEVEVTVIPPADVSEDDLATLATEVDDATTSAAAAVTTAVAASGAVSLSAPVTTTAAVLDTTATVSALPFPPPPPPCAAQCTVFLNDASYETEHLCIKYERAGMTTCSPLYGLKCDSGMVQCSSPVVSTPTSDGSCDKKDKKGKWRKKKCVKKVGKKPDKCTKKKVGKKCKQTCCEAGF